MSKRITERKFFTESAEVVAQWLIGKILCHKTVDEKGEPFIIKCRISVTEAYRESDSFTDNNREANPTAQILSGGHIHFYSKKGECRQRLDIVAGDEGKAESVLIRGVDPYEEGPARVVWALDANKNCDGIDLLDENSDYWIEDDGAIVESNEPTQRINVKSDELLRFSMKGFNYKKR